METLDLYRIAENEKINIYFHNFKDLNGLFCLGDIYLNKKILNTYKEKEVLAEELAHYYSGVLPTPPFSTDYYIKLIRSKNEYKAKKWLVNKLIPFDTLKHFLKQNMSKYEISEEIGISASLVEDAFKIYKNI